MNENKRITLYRSIGIFGIIVGIANLIIKTQSSYIITSIITILLGLTWLSISVAENINSKRKKALETNIKLLENRIKKLSEENTKLKNKIKVDIDEIIVPEDFTHPNPIKIEGRLEFYNKTKRFRTPIIVDKNYKLLNGYTSYLIAKSKDLKVVEVIVSES